MANHADHNLPPVLIPMLLSLVLIRAVEIIARFHSTRKGADDVEIRREHEAVARPRTHLVLYRCYGTLDTNESPLVISPAGALFFFLRIRAPGRLSVGPNLRVSNWDRYRIPRFNRHDARGNSSQNIRWTTGPARLMQGQRNISHRISEHPGPPSAAGDRVNQHDTQEQSTRLRPLSNHQSGSSLWAKLRVTKKIPPTEIRSGGLPFYSVARYPSLMSKWSLNNEAIAFPVHPHAQGRLREVEKS
ncbi:hypothetical protein C8R43DRAFT_944023 [Mycena crocata]|nr:hypothetical protein C8R43DRAFT_944023 [Mycena crocata]